MQTEKNKKKGLIILIVGILLTYFSFEYFNLFGTKISYKNPLLFLEMLFSVSLLLTTLYLGLYFTSGKKLANQIGGGVAIFLIAAIIFGAILHP